jgi:integrase
MLGGIYTGEDCPLCGQRMRDNGRSAVCCPKHRNQITNNIYVRFGRDIKRRFKAYEAASRFLNGVRYESDKGSFDPRDYSANRPLSFTNLSERYIEIREKDLKPGSFKVLRPRLRRAQQYFEHASVKLIRYAQLDDFIRAQEDLSSKSKHELCSALHAFWRWLIDREEMRLEDMPKFPKIQVKMQLRKTVDKETQFAILNEIKRISRANPKIYLGCLWLATYINLRPAELRGILESDVDRQRGIVWVRNHKTDNSTKDAKYIVLIPEDQEALKRIPKGFPKQHFFRIQKGNGAAKPGDSFGPDLLYSTWKRACNNLGIEGVDLYGGTRHSSAQALREHMSREEVKELTGHHTSASFTRYFWADFEALRDGYGKTRR